MKKIGSTYKENTNGCYEVEVFKDGDLIHINQDLDCICLTGEMFKEIGLISEKNNGQHKIVAKSTVRILNDILKENDYKKGIKTLIKMIEKTEL